MDRRRFVMAMPLMAGLTACATMMEEGPGMNVTFSNGLKSKKLMFEDDKVISSSGKRFASPGSLGPDKNLMQGGKTMSAAPDGRQLPEWVEFTWQEWPYPSPPMPKPSESQALQAWKERVHTLSQTLPRNTARVYVRSRVPQDAIDEVMEAKRHRKQGDLPDKMLYIYFIWTETGIKFRWEVGRGGKTFRQGGDDIAR